MSYKKRVTEINKIYERHAKSGLSNREIWRRFVYPKYGISERSFYNIINSAGDASKTLPPDAQLFFDFWENHEQQHFYKQPHTEDTE